MSKIVTINIDPESGVKYLALSSDVVSKTVSLSEEGCKYLDDSACDIVLDFNENDKLIGIELIGFE